jgi:hypothetical protein
LQEDFLVYLKSVDRSDGTISQYKKFLLACNASLFHNNAGAG